MEHPMTGSTFYQPYDDISPVNSANLQRNKMLSAMTIKHWKTCRKEKIVYIGKLVASAI